MQGAFMPMLVNKIYLIMYNSKELETQKTSSVPSPHRVFDQYVFVETSQNPM